MTIRKDRKNSTQSLSIILLVSNEYIKLKSTSHYFIFWQFLNDSPIPVLINSLFLIAHGEEVQWALVKLMC